MSNEFNLAPFVKNVDGFMVCLACREDLGLAKQSGHRDGCPHEQRRRREPTRRPRPPVE